MKKIRLLSAFLTVVMVFGMLSGFTAYAATTTTGAALVPGIDPDTNEPTIDYLNQVFATPEDKLATMTKYLSQNGMELYVEPVSGEIAYVNSATGQILFSNPYDVATCGSTSSIKEQLLSQILIKYSQNNTELSLWSFKEACQRGQILVKKIKNGVRVEYTIGRAETRKLVPRQIEQSRFEELILANIPEDSRAYRKTSAFYTLVDINDETLTEQAKKEIQLTYPIASEMSFYILSGASERDKTELEGYIKTYCPEYTFETLEEDHAMTMYEGQDEASALFRLSLEYTLDDDGTLDVRLPANGIRFDESNFQLTSISILPYMGAGSSDYTGYTMIPDGSGALVRFEDVQNTSVILTGKLYDQDYAYQQIEGAHREVMRLPVWGVVETGINYDKFRTDDGTEPELPASAPHPTGYFAIIEEGDALATITAEHGGAVHKYNNVYTSFSPRPKDTYNLAEALSVGQNATYTVVSDRKYIGSYRIKYTMLTGAEVAKEKGLKDYYDATYVGMAEVYRDYLIRKGEIERFDSVDNDLPLYIESFGCINDIERVLSMPVEVLKPITTFDDLKNMYAKLSEAGVTNINFKLTGFANGGLDETAPTKVKFEKVVGGNSGYTDFVQFAEANNVGVFPDFDFAYVGKFEFGDGISKKEYLVKTMDGRYTTKRVYDSTLQSYEKSRMFAISPSVYSTIFESFNKSIQKLSPSGISVATLGTDLNSDFDEKEPYNREDTREFTEDLLTKIDENFSEVMIDGGNKYAIPYADHMINVPLDSSRYINASNSIPFMGMVFHGSKSFAGTAINMAGDTSYELLKAIENGSSLYFTLSYQNTSLLKESEEFNKYYSVAFDIWFDEVVDIYTELNDAIGDLQDKLIVDHEFLIGERVPDEDEVAADAAEIQAAIEAEEEAKRIAEEKAARKKAFEERTGIISTPVKEEVAEETEAEGESEAEAESTDGYKYTKYTSDDGRIVKVIYEGGKAFVLNYNNFAVTVEIDGKTYQVDALGFAVVK